MFRARIGMRKLVLIAGLVCAFSACKRNTRYQGEGASFIQGTWIQETVPFQDSLLRFQLHRFRFTCDSVYITIHQNARVQTIPLECFNQGEWTEFARGVYVVRNDSLLIEATYTHADGRQKLTGCYTIGQYLERFDIEGYRGDSLFLMSSNSHVPVALRRSEKTTCIPKIVY